MGYIDTQRSCLFVLWFLKERTHENSSPRAVQSVRWTLKKQNCVTYGFVTVLFTMWTNYRRLSLFCFCWVEFLMAGLMIRNIEFDDGSWENANVKVPTVINEGVEVLLVRNESFLLKSRGGFLPFWFLHPRWSGEECQEEEAFPLRKFEPVSLLFVTDFYVYCYLKCIEIWIAKST